MGSYGGAVDEDEVDPSARLQELVRAVMPHVQRLAPVLADAPVRDADQQGIDAVLRSTHEADQIRARVQSWLDAKRLADRVEVWLWSAGSSGGAALTAAGREVGRELRLSRRGKR